MPALPHRWVEKCKMNLGFNQNIVYKGETYHVQTEDGGGNNPVITTLLFRGGVILASRRTEYSDILKSDRLKDAIKELMVEQHRTMIKHLLEGSLDDKL